MNTGKKFLSDLKFFESYSKWNDKLQRKETWEESVEDVMKMHYHKFKGIAELQPYLKKAEEAYKNKEILASQRNLQYREEQILKSNTRLFNCSSTYIDRPEVFKEAMWVLLNGCGVGYSVERRFVDKLPTIKQRPDKTITHIVEDSIEGWANALDALMMSFFNGTEKIRFDGRLVRPEGAFISGGFKAPGYEPLKKSLELIESILERKLGVNTEYKLTSLDAHEIICISSDAVLSAGVRRSAIICLFDKDDDLMLKAKTGDWYIKKPWLARANNSIKLLRGSFTEEEFNGYKESIKQYGDPGIVMVDDLRFCTNPCAEIGFIPINPRTGNTCWSFCNLNEINGGACTTKEKFFEACENAAILGTLQASYTDMPFLGSDTKELIELESLIGVSITGIMDNPQVFINAETLQAGAKIVNETNEKIAKLIGINPAARTTTVKPSGNASVLLQTSSGIHSAHSKKYFRIVQMNKNNDVAKAIAKINPIMLENSIWNTSGTDYAIFIPIRENEEVLTKDKITDSEFLGIVNLVFENWVLPGTHTDRGYSKYITHNVSNTITVNDWDKTFHYIYTHQRSFCGLSFLADAGDKTYKQAPFTKVMEFDELIKSFGTGVLFASGLVVDALHNFDDDLWDACDAVKNRSIKFTGDRYKVILKKDIVRRIKKFAKNYFNGDIDKTIDCLKNVHVFHKYETISREIIPVNFTDLKVTPTYTEVAAMGAVACSGGACEITRI
jgi:ribonucleoside-diphosphate reductase alpha chain